MVLALDSDASGFESTKRTLADIEELEFKVEVALFDYAKDPDEALHADANRFKKVVAKPVPIYDYVIQHGLSQLSDDPYSKKAIAESILPILSSIKNPILYEHYKKKMAEGLEVSTQALDQTVVQLAQKQKQPFAKAEKKEREKGLSREESLQQFILSYLLHLPNPKQAFEVFKVDLPLETFTDIAYKEIATKMYDVLQNQTGTGPIDITKFLQSLPVPLHEPFDTLYLFDTSSAGVLSDNELRKQALELRRIVLRKYINEKIKQSFTLAEDQLTDLKNKKLELAKVEKDLTMM